MNADGTNKDVRKYVVGRKNAGAPTLRIPHDRQISFHATERHMVTPPMRQIMTTKTKDNVKEIAPHNFQITHNYHQSRPRPILRSTQPKEIAVPTRPSAQSAPSLAPIRPAGQPTQVAAANLIRRQIQQIDDPNREIIEHAKQSTTPNKTTDTARLLSSNFLFHSVADATAQKRATAEAQKKYHTAWRRYYQQYYEHYYAAEMARQEAERQKEFATQHAHELNNNFSRNYLGAAAGKATAILRDHGTIEGTENARAAEMNNLRYSILSRVHQSAKKVRRSRHFIPAIAAVVMILIVSFLQFNGVIFATVANFVSPGNTSGQSIIVGTGANQPIGSDSQIIIPKINVQSPVQYGVNDLSEQGAQTALQNGPINYPIAAATAVPGQKGNTVVLGHSSADWFAPGNFKFIFVQLNRLSEGDLFYLDYQGTRYTYRVTRTQIIAPTQLGALNLGTDRPYATLITCDPPGTATNRLLVVGEQISPSPDQTTTTQTNSDQTADQITGSPPTLLEKIFGGK